MLPPTAAPAAVLFDFGMTLLGRRPGPELVAEGAVALGAPAPEPARAEALWEAVQARARTPEEMGKGRDLSPGTHRACWTALYAPFDALAPGLSSWLYERESSASGWTPYPDTVPALEALRRAGIAVGVVSDTGFDLRPLFGAHGLAGLVDVWSLSCEVGVVKPDPELFLRPCRELGIEPGAALMVGDNHRTDGGAAEVGMPAIVLPLVAPGRPRGFDAVLRWCAVAPTGQALGS